MAATNAADFRLILELLHDEIASSDLLPPTYRKYQLLVAESVRFFLSRMSRARLEPLLRDLLALPFSASTAERMVTLLHHTPVLHKLAQVVARDRRLSADFRQWLQTLESLEPRTPVGSVLKVLRRELGSNLHEVTLGAASLAEGSVAAVIPFTWKSRNAGRPEGVFKVLKPGIATKLEEDLDILSALAGFVDRECERFGLPPLEYQETFETIRQLLANETHLEAEQHHMAEMRRFYSDSGSVCIPRLFSLCSPQVTAMERLRGRKLLLGPQERPSRKLALATVAADALVCRPFFSPATAATFHGDPHAGNLLETEEGRLGLLDWSLAGRLAKDQRITLMHLLLAAMNLDSGQMERAIALLATVEPQLSPMKRVIETSLSELRKGAVPAAGWLTRLLDSLVTKANVKLQTNLLLFRKGLLTLEGVFADLVGEERRTEVLDQAFISSFVRRWMAEWPDRMFALPADRSFTTHVSNADMAATWVGLPVTLHRWWTGVVLGSLRSRV